MTVKTVYTFLQSVDDSLQVARRRIPEYLNYETKPLGCVCVSPSPMSLLVYIDFVVVAEL
jgi:hypothetical protein